VDQGPRVRNLSVALSALFLCTFPIGVIVPGLLFLATSRPQRSWPFLTPSIAVTGAVVASLVGLQFDRHSLSGAISLLGMGLILYLLTTRMKGADLAPLSAGVASGLFIQAAVAVSQVVALERLQAQGLTFHPNILGSLAVVGGGFLLGAQPRFRRAFRGLLIAGCVASAVCIVTSLSRGALVGAVVVLISSILIRLLEMEPGRRRIAMRYAAAAALLITATATLVLVRRGQELDSLVDDRGRLFLLEQGAILAAESPLLGNGKGAWLRLLPAVEPTVRVGSLQNSHNLPMELVLEGGSLLFTSMAFMLAALGARLAASRAARSIALVPFLGFMLHNFFDVLLYHGQLAFLVALIVAVGLAHEEPADVRLRYPEFTLE
jgi:hypothetical protein